jgi:hypothetical protein
MAFVHDRIAQFRAVATPGTAMLQRTLPTLLLSSLVLGCSTADGLDPGSSDTGGPPDPLEPAPAPDGSACGGETFGWWTDCVVSGQVSYENPLDPGQYLELEPFVGPTFGCCEGKPDQATADEACVERCTKQLCDIAKNIYDDIARENEWSCTQGCTFDMTGCLAGIPVQQFPHAPFGDYYPHEVTVSCAAMNVEPRTPDGTFTFVTTGLVNPETCGDPPEAQAAGLLPLGALIANTAQEDAGTYALASWWTGTGEEKSQQGTIDVAAELAYAVRPCGEEECLELTRMHASIPEGPYAGLSVQSADLTLIAVSEPPVIDRTGGFEFPAGSLHFVLTATVGEASLAITRTNTTPARGRVSHAADLFEVTDLRLGYEESNFGAELRMDLVAAHTNRAPRAAIRRLDTPLDCDDPVVLQAATVDLDDDPMQHYWWTPNGMVQAATAELVLPTGAHFVVLVSVDQHGAHDATSLTFKRSCS